MTYHISDDAAGLAEPLPVQVPAPPPSKRSHGWRLRLSGLLRSNQPQQELCEAEVHPSSPPPSAPAPAILSPVSTYPALRPRRASTDSFPTHVDRDIDEDDAARRIQLWIRELRQRGTSVGLRGSMAQTIASDDDLETDDDEFGADRDFDVYLWEAAALGLEFDVDDTRGLPRVTMSEGNAAFPGMWHVRLGDLLVAINDAPTSDMSFDDTMHILDHGMRPAVLRFRHPPSSSSRPLDAAMVQYRRRCEVLDRDLTYVFWREDDGPLGLTLKPPLGHGYPRVRTVHEDGTVARVGALVGPGDELIRINQQDVSTLGGRTSLQVLRAAPRPLVLTFHRRRPRSSGRPTTTTVASTWTSATTTSSAVAGAETL